MWKDGLRDGDESIERKGVVNEVEKEMSGEIISEKMAER